MYDSMILCKLAGHAIFKQDCKYVHLSNQKEQCEQNTENLRKEMTKLEFKLDSIKTELMQKMVVLMNEMHRNYQSELEFERNRVQENGIVVSSSSTMKYGSGRGIKKEPSAMMTKMLARTSSTFEVDGDDVLGFLDLPSKAISPGRISEGKRLEREEREEKPKSASGKIKKRKTKLNLMPSSSSEEEDG